ncbi:MAG: sugar phosphate isomerase/epimerase family protein, partial [Planctomycetota bacterium]
MPAESTMQINYWTVGGFEGAKRPEVALEEAKAMGYEGVELCFGAGELSSGITEARCREIASAARALGMKIDSLATGNYWQQSLTHPDAAVRKAAVAFTKEYLQVAKWLGAGVVLVIPGAVAVPWDDSQPVVPYADAWKRATAGIKACVKTAEKLKVTIAVENVWNWFLADPVAMKTFVDQFKSKRVGVYFDVANCLLNGYPEHWIAMLGKRVKVIHFKNFSRSDCAGGLHGFGDDLMAGDVD